MEKLLYIEHKNRDLKGKTGKECIAALLVSLSVCICFRDLFSLRGFLAGIGTPGGGLICIWNQIVKALGSSDYVLLDVRAGASTGCGLFAILCFLVLALAAFLLIRTGYLWTMLVFVFPICFLDIFFQVSLSLAAGGFLFGAILFALCCMRQETGGGMLHFLFAAVILALTVSLTWVGGISCLTQKPAAVQQVNASVKQHLSDGYYGTNPLGSGDLTQRKRQGGSDTALEIAMQRPHSMYLRGFVGEQFDGKRWKHLPAGTYYQAENLMYWLSQSGCTPLGQVRDAAMLTGNESPQGEIQIAVQDADRRYAYIPYEICDPILEEGRAWGGSFISAPVLGRLSSYSYEAGDNVVKDWTVLAARMFTTAAAGSQAEKTQQYLEAESYYNTFVYENYTALSKADKKRISEYLGPSGDQSKGHIDYKEAIGKIRTYLSEYFIYTENLGADAGESSFLEVFLSSGKGYDVQFATAAVLMFRYYGIPARYVEGYLVTPEDVKGVQPYETIAISRDRAHAWVEIYIDGIGFVPLEVSPTYIGVMEEADLSVGISNNTLLRPFDDQSESSSGASVQLQDGGDDARHPSFIWLIVAVIILCGALFMLLFFLLRKLYQKLSETIRRRRLFYQSPPKTAVSGIYGYLDEMGISVKEEIRELGNRAAYSRNPIQEEDRIVMLGYLKEALREQKALKKTQRNMEHQNM